MRYQKYEQEQNGASDLHNWFKKKKATNKWYRSLTRVMWLIVIFSCCSHPTVVMEINDHQNPSPTPLLKEAGNSSGFCFMSCSNYCVKQKFKRILYTSNKLPLLIWARLDNVISRNCRIRKKTRFQTEEKKETHAYFHKAYALNDGRFGEREVKTFYVPNKFKQHCTITAPIYASTGNELTPIWCWFDTKSLV